MRDPPFDRPAGCNERLRGDEAAEDSRATVVWTESAEEIGVEPLQIEPLKKAF